MSRSQIAFCRAMQPTYGIGDSDAQSEATPLGHQHSAELRKEVRLNIPIVML